MRTMRRVNDLLALGLALAVIVNAAPADAGSAAEIDRDVDAVLAKLYASLPHARDLGSRASGVLVFPSIVKAGFLFGAVRRRSVAPERGHERLLQLGGRVYGLQAGAQVFGYALFFMNDAALRYLEDSGGFELGTGPSLVVLDAGAAQALSTTTMQNDIYAVFFDQKGLMGGLGLQGSKISRIDP
jgi:lipid-binding SYLF domain-containing protein